MRCTPRAFVIEIEDRSRGAIRKPDAQTAIQHDDAKRQRANERIEAFVFRAGGRRIRLGPIFGSDLRRSVIPVAQPHEEQREENSADEGRYRERRGGLCHSLNM